MAEEKRGARLSDCGQYRYSLNRVWDAGKLLVTFVMLNPSTADGLVDDATIRSCRRLCKSWGYGGLIVVNLFAWRATDPAELTKSPDPVGPDNDGYIRAALWDSDFAICAWGAHKMAEGRGAEVVNLLNKHGKLPHCLGTTKSGAPKHPLYIATGTTPQVYCGLAGKVSP